MADSSTKIPPAASSPKAAVAAAAQNNNKNNRPTALVIPVRQKTVELPASPKQEPSSPRSPGGGSPLTTSPRLVSARVRNPSMKGHEILELIDETGATCSPNNKTHGFISRYGLVDAKGGSGAYGVVRRMMRMDLSEREWAVKQTPKALFSEHQARQGGSKECVQPTSDTKIERFRIVMEAIMNLEKAQQYVTPIEQIFEDTEYWYTIMPHCSGSLKEYLAFNHYMPDTTIKDFMWQLLCGISSLHTRKSEHITSDGKVENYEALLHRDIKPDNILLMDANDSHLGICDFDLSLFKNMEDGSIVGTPGYIDPQVMEQDPYSEKSDLYSIGCILFQMITGMKPPTALSLPSFVQAAHTKVSRGVSFADGTEVDLALDWQEKIASELRRVLLDTEGRGKGTDLNEALRIITLECLHKYGLIKKPATDQKTMPARKQSDFRKGWMVFPGAEPTDDYPDTPGYYLQYKEFQLPEGMDEPVSREQARHTARLLKVGKDDVSHRKVCGFIETAGGEFIFMKRELFKYSGSPQSPRGSSSKPNSFSGDLSNALNDSITGSTEAAEEMKAIAMARRDKDLPKLEKREGSTFHYLIPSTTATVQEPNSPVAFENVDLHRLLYCLIAPYERDTESSEAESGSRRSPPASPRGSVRLCELKRCRTAEEVKLKFWGRIDNSPQGSPRKTKSSRKSGMKKSGSRIDQLLMEGSAADVEALSPPGSPGATKTKNKPAW